MMKQVEVVELVRETTQRERDSPVVASLLDRAIAATNARGAHGREVTVVGKAKRGHWRPCVTCGKMNCRYVRPVWVEEGEN